MRPIHMLLCEYTMRLKFFEPATRTQLAEVAFRLHKTRDYPQTLQA
jgi:hypothetical protein